MTKPFTAKPRNRSKFVTVIGIAVLMFLIIVGFQRGWLAFRNDQRPVGKLRPVDLVTSIPLASPSSSSSFVSTSSSVPMLTPTQTDDDDTTVDSIAKVIPTNSSVPQTTVRRPDNDGDKDD
jgi:hypothetical protein